ncbi:hypothetical protein PULV_a3881 [Pseudoalteromonas ulvae UL12]|nr:hypothetical protein [Pseudoalteromonas ulvae UL12]
MNRIPVVYEMRSTWEEDLRGKFLINFQRKIVKKLEEYTARLSKGVVFVSAGIKEHYNLNDLKNENSVIYNSVVEIDGVVNKAVGDVFHFGYVGSLAYYEGLDGIIPAARKLIDEYDISNFKVFIYGSGSEFEPIKKLIIDNDLVDYIILKGRVDFEDMAAVYNNIDAILLPRKNLLITNKVAGLKPLEAFANKKLVLASNVGGMRELFVNGKHGYFFEADNSNELTTIMADVISNYEDKKSVIPTAFKFYQEKYSGNAMFSQYIKIYNKVK